jgi:aspartyl-tRNA synthetase
MTITEHYYEALDMMGQMFIYIFDGISDRYQNELQIISQQYPFEPITYLRPPLRITFPEGIKLLQVLSNKEK